MNRAIEVPAEVIAAVGALRAPVVISHVVPDADALGSMFAVAAAYVDASHAPCASLPEGSLSQRLSFLMDLTQAKPATDEDFAAADGFIVLDTAKKERCNVGADRKQTDWIGGRPIVNIDHHITNTQYGAINWVIEAGSTCEMVYHLLSAAGRPISANIASLLYAGIQTDSIGFSLPNTAPSSLRAAADLVELGADVGLLGERLWRSQRQGEFDLLRVIYANTRTAAGGRIAYSSASYEEIHDAGCTAADIDDQINVPRSLDGVQLAMLFTEGRRGRTRINFRGSGDVTVVELAAQFGGGGHAQAAGAIVDASLDETIARVLPVAEQHLTGFAVA
ncbi:MAG: DHH family phosphoesterase [Phycisphaerae bacterium]|nr:DHH family phosphoesterase [Phycisphaerae bacterium]